MPDRLLDTGPDQLTVVGMDEPDELRIGPAERARLEPEHQLELLRPVEPARDEIPLPRRHPAGIECQSQALLALPERLLAFPSLAPGLDLVELPGDRRHEPGEVALVDEVPGSRSQRIGSLLLPDHARDQDRRKIDLELGERPERLHGGFAVLQAVVEEQDLPRTLVQRFQHLAAAVDAPSDRVVAPSA